MTYRHLDVKRPDLFLSDGRLATSLRLGPLLAELQRLSIPGVEAAMAKGALLDAYEKHVTELVDKIRKTETPGARHPKEITQAVAKLAAKLIEQQIGEPFGFETQNKSGLPPIASTRL
jgi:hypothetical protein